MALTSVYMTSKSDIVHAYVAMAMLSRLMIVAVVLRDRRRVVRIDAVADL